MARSRWLAAAAAAALVGPPANAACVVGRIAELPVTMHGMQPLVPAKVNGADVTMIADSGAFFSLISPASAEQLHLKVTPSFVISIGGIGGSLRAGFAQVKVFTLANTNIPNIEFLVAGGETGSDSAGLLGQNVLGYADVEYDFGHGMIRLMRPQGCEHADLAYWAGARSYSILRTGMTSRERPETRSVIQVNGVNMHVVFDTGASTSIMSLEAARRLEIRPDAPVVAPAGLTRGVGRRLISTWLAPVASLQLGDEEIKNTRIRFGDIALEGTDMLIGADFFLSHRVFVANSQHRMYFTYEGGSVFDLRTAADADAPEAKVAVSAAAPEAPDAPTDAAGFSRRGAVRLSRREYVGAEADFTRAIALAPDDPAFVYQRALVRLGRKQLAPAAADLDTALKLKPADAPARLARAQLRLGAHDLAGARADADAAAASVAAQADARLTLAEIYAALDAFAPAVSQYDLWIASHRDDGRLATALNGRCWTRALEGRELDLALLDCNAAARLLPGDPQVLDSRGLVHLRRGEFERALADYDAALKRSPGQAWSLYGRGLAKLRIGHEEAGRADLAAAKVLAPALPARAAKLGLAAG